jgi:hypothetical protein
LRTSNRQHVVKAAITKCGCRTSEAWHHARAQFTRCADLVGIECELHVLGVAVSGLAAYRQLLRRPLAVEHSYLGFTAIEAWRMDGTVMLEQGFLPSVAWVGGGLQGIHRSAVVGTDIDEHTGNAIEVFLWSFKEERPYLQLEFPGYLHDGIELTIPQVCWLALVLVDLAAAAESSGALVETDARRSPRQMVVTRSCLGGRRRY